MLNQFLPKIIQNWLARRAKQKVDYRLLPWWGIIMNTNDKKAIVSLLESERRINLVLNQPGWSDIESIIHDWVNRYTEIATHLGHKTEDREGRLMIIEEDTQADDRKRLIACAQTEALKGLLTEIKRRSKVSKYLEKRDKHNKDVEDAVLEYDLTY